MRSPQTAGRDAELAELRSLLGEAVSGRPRVVLVVGDAGVGKSRLLADLIDLAHGRDTWTLIGQCERGRLFGAVVNALRRLAEGAVLLLLFLFSFVMPIPKGGAPGVVSVGPRLRTAGVVCGNVQGAAANFAFDDVSSPISWPVTARRHLKVRFKFA